MIVESGFYDAVSLVETEIPLLPLGGRSHLGGDGGVFGRPVPVTVMDLAAVQGSGTYSVLMRGESTVPRLVVVAGQIALSYPTERRARLLAAVMLHWRNANAYPFPRRGCGCAWEIRLNWAGYGGSTISAVFI